MGDGREGFSGRRRGFGDGGEGFVCASLADAAEWWKARAWKTADAALSRRY